MQSLIIYFMLYVRHMHNIAKICIESLAKCICRQTTCNEQLQVFIQMLCFQLQ